MDMSFTDAELRCCEDFIVKLAIDAGRIITSAFSRTGKNFAEKLSSHDLVTETDDAVEKFIISAICDKFPTHRFIGEESSAQAQHNLKNPLLSRLTNEPTWMIDPIDGTMNFVHCNPHICLSIGLVASKIPILGVIYNPVMNELYSARVNGGAYRNGQAIHVSNATNLDRSLLATDFGSILPKFMAERISTAGKVMQKVHGVRAVGSSALHMALVGSGAVDCMYEFGLHCWDMAAGTVIVREAGGVVFDSTGGDLDLMSRRVLCASTPQLAHELATQLDSQIFHFPRD